MERKNKIENLTEEEISKLKQKYINFGIILGDTFFGIILGAGFFFLYTMIKSLF